jgi:hypothetical protein
VINEKINTKLNVLEKSTMQRSSNKDIKLKLIKNINQDSRSKVFHPE